MPPLGEALKSGVRLPYTQWEAWLALYHGKPLMIAKAKTAAREAHASRQTTPRARRKSNISNGSRRSTAIPAASSRSPDDLAKQIAYSAILDLLVADYAEKFGRERDVAEGFIREMAKRVAAMRRSISTA